VIPRLWPKETITCVASGPSLTPEDAARCRRYGRILAVNDGVRSAPWAEALYAAEEKWWTWNHNVFHYLPRYKFTVSRTAALKYQIGFVEPRQEAGLCVTPDAIAHGGHSGYGAVNVAFHLGGPPKRIVLLGYDMQTGPQGEHHFFGEHPDGSHLAYQARLRLWPALYETLHALGVELINATRSTALTCMPCIPLEELFP
jgi:hypothetical protein